jgi:sialic acid synthase SpsE
MTTSKSFQIEGRPVGRGKDPLVIAEIGINHGGNIDAAVDMVDAAARAGVEVVKHQTHIVEDEMAGAAKAIIPGNSDKSIYQIMSECALNETDERRLMDYVRCKGMIFISTPFSRAAALRLHQFDVPAFKIGSGECNNYPLLRLVAGFGKPIILSTGMNNLASVGKAVAIFESARVPYALLHTTNLYPTPHHLVRLGGMTTLMQAFPGVPVGLSDHTVDNYSSFAAVALGASIIEKHFTDHRDREGPDIVCSMDEGACRELITASRIIFSELGGDKEAAKEEGVTIDFAFASVVTIAAVSKGECFTEGNLWVKRPGKNGIPAEQYESILGRRATRAIPADRQLQPTDYE